MKTTGYKNSAVIVVCIFLIVTSFSSAAIDLTDKTSTTEMRHEIENINLVDNTHAKELSYYLDFMEPELAEVRLFDSTSMGSPSTVTSVTVVL